MAQSKLKLIPIFIFCFLFSARPAYAHGQEALIIFFGEATAYMTGFVLLLVSKASGRRRLCALASLIVGMGVTIALGLMPYRPNTTFINTGTALATFLSLGLSVWLTHLKGLKIDRRKVIDAILMRTREDGSDGAE